MGKYAHNRPCALTWRDLHFSQAIAQARAKARQSLIKVVKEAAITDWRAAAWILERSYREEYGKSWADEHPAQRIELNISADEHARRLREIFGRPAPADAEVMQSPNKDEDGETVDVVKLD
jgi:hypothetical protein